MNAARLNLAVVGVVTFAAALAALIPIHPMFRITGGAVAFVLHVAGAWWSVGHFGPHAVYYARSGRGAVIYVGQMTRRRDSVGDANIEERLREHLADVDDKPWKRDIVIANSTVARRCWTTAGLSASERRRIAALSAAGRQGACGTLHNTLLVPGDDDGRHTLSMWWYALESRLSLDDGAAWHRPVRRVGAAPTVDDGWTDAVDDDVFGDVDDATTDEDDEPIVATADYARPPGRPTFTVLALGPVAGDATGDGSDADGPLRGPGGSGGVAGRHATRDRRPDAGHDSDVESDNGVAARQTDENGDSSASQGRGATSAGARPTNGTNANRASRDKTCIADGCDCVAVRQSRCTDHAREYDRERQRRRRTGKDGQAA